MLIGTFEEPCPGLRRTAVVDSSKVLLRRRYQCKISPWDGTLGRSTFDHIGVNAERFFSFL